MRTLALLFLLLGVSCYAGEVTSQSGTVANTTLTSANGNVTTETDGTLTVSGLAMVEQFALSFGATNGNFLVFDSFGNVYCTNKAPTSLIPNLPASIITSGIFTGNGGGLTNLQGPILFPSNSSFATAAQPMTNAQGCVVVTTNGAIDFITSIVGSTNQNRWNFGTNGTLTTPGGVTAGGDIAAGGNNISGNFITGVSRMNAPGFVNTLNVTATSVAVGASPWTYTAGATEETVIIVGGTVSAITWDGFAMPAGIITAVNAATPVTLTLHGSRTAVITYTVAPTFISKR